MPLWWKQNFKLGHFLALAADALFIVGTLLWILLWKDPSERDAFRNPQDTGPAGFDQSKRERR